MEKGHIYGQTEENIMEIGKIIELKEKEFLNGLMVENILVIIRKIKSMDMEYLSGQMEKNIKDIGKMVNKMVMVNIIILEKMPGLKDFGKMERNKFPKKMVYQKLVKVLEAKNPIIFSLNMEAILTIKNNFLYFLFINK